MTTPRLRIEDLCLILPGEDGPRRILDHVTLDLLPGEVMGLVGESGSGKTMTALAIMRLLPLTARLAGGHIWFDGQDLLTLPESKMQAIRGARIAMIFQNPREALNPLMRAGDQIARAVRFRQRTTQREAYARAVELMRHVGIADAASRARAYPHQLSGGMAQRVLVAMMLACQPEVLIADEPTTGLDVTIQAQIFELIKAIQAETGVAMLLITHDLGIVAEVCQRVAVMYAGQIMEIAPVGELFARPAHPYTERLLGSIVRVDRPTDLDAVQALPPITTDYESQGCRFVNQCPYVRAVCHERRPPPIDLASGHRVFCYQYMEETL